MSDLEISDETSVNSIIGNSKPVQEIRDVIKKIAQADSPIVLIQGEIGTGKELAARALHHENRHVSGLFASVNISDLRETAVENHLFGYERRESDEEDKTEKGYFENANSGYLFINNVDELNLSSQSKLIDAIDKRKIHRVGGKADIDVDVRIIASTKMDLEILVDQNKFNKELFKSLSENKISMPPLRSRGEDIIQLATFYLQKYCLESDKKFKGISKEAESRLLHYRWPGNVRELKNLMERLVLLNNEILLNPEILKGL
jgi:DNA-binding NtrC family response regulator